MPIRAVGGTELAGRWNLSARWVEGIPVERAELRFTATYALTDTFRAGVEVNPGGEKSLLEAELEDLLLLLLLEGSLADLLELSC